MGRLKSLTDLAKKIMPHFQRALSTDAGKKVGKKTLKAIAKKVTQRGPDTSRRTKAEDYRKDHHANLSGLAYEQDAAKKSKKARKLGYDIDEELTTANHTVFKHRKTGKAIIAYRGTDPTNSDDLLADADIAQGKRTHKRFRDALEVAKRAQKKYKDLELAGHSLGGTQALHVYESLGLKTRVFNPGASVNQKLQVHSNGLLPEIIRHESDLVSKGWEPNATETYGEGNTLGDLVYEGYGATGKNLLDAHKIPGIDQ